MDREIPPSGFTKSGKTLGKPRVLPDLVTPRVGFPYPHLYGMKESYNNFIITWKIVLCFYLWSHSVLVWRNVNISAFASVE